MLGGMFDSYRLHIFFCNFPIEISKLPPRIHEKIFLRTELETNFSFDELI